MNIADQVLGGTLTHTEYNTHKNSNQNAITTSGQTASSGDTNQLAKAMANYAGVSNFYTESGAADAYVLTPISSFLGPHQYENGLLVRFRAGNANTGASTVNVDSLGVKNIKQADGSTDPSSGDIPTTRDTWLRYDGTNFRIQDFGTGGGPSSFSAVTKDINQTTHGFVVGDWLRVSGGAYTKAQADTLANSQAVGVVSSVSDVNNFTIQMSGYISGLSGLTANSLHYLDASTAGAETTTEPTISKPVIFADSTSSGHILPQRPLDTSEVGPKVVQVVNVTDGTVATGTTQLPGDNTIPQNTEGVEFMTLAITPNSTSNKLIIDIRMSLAHSSSSSGVNAALFQDTTVNALAAFFTGKGSGTNDECSISFTHYMTAGTTSSTTFKVRAGSGAAGTTTFNGSSGTQKFGGVQASSITITEIEA